MGGLDSGCNSKAAALDFDRGRVIVTALEECCRELLESRGRSLELCRWWWMADALARSSREMALRRGGRVLFSVE